MKKAILICLFLGFLSCKGQEKKAETFIDVNVEEFQKMIGKKGAQLIDVRTPGEYENGHLKDALLINYMAMILKQKHLKAWIKQNLFWCIVLLVVDLQNLQNCIKKLVLQKYIIY